MNDAVIDSSGRIIICGSVVKSDGVRTMLVARLTSSGTLDTTFGWLGASGAPAWSYETSAVACTLDSSGKIVVLSSNGLATPGFLLVRLNSNGSVDGTFGFGGYASVTFGVSVFPADVKVGPDGKIVAVGSTTNEFATVTDAVKGRDTAVARFTANGVLDGTFSGDGMDIRDVGALDQASSLAIDAWGRIVVAGTSEANWYSMWAIRYTSAGDLDSTFATSGRLFINIPGHSGAFGRAVAIDSTNRIVLGGTADGFGGGWTLFRASSAGVLDSTFGNGGMAALALGPWSEPKAITLTSDGKFIMAGWSGPTFDPTNVAVVRWLSNGQLDSRFGQGGVVITTDVGVGQGVVVDDKLRPIVAGYR